MRPLPERAPATKQGETGARHGAAGAWRDAFLNLPYLRDVLTRASLIVDTFETAITWDRFESFHEQVIGATRDAVKRHVVVQEGDGEHPRDQRDEDQ